jgi:hypothetical protein
VRSPKLGAAISIALLVVYLLLLGNWGVAMIRGGQLVGIFMGALVLAFPLLGVWAIWRELRFGIKVEAMGKELEAAGEWPVFQLVIRPSGRPTRESADENFKTVAATAAANPESWKAAFALSLAYDACGDRPRARKAMAEAMTLHAK